MATIPKGAGSMESILKRIKAADERYNLWRSLHSEAMDYATPQRETISHKTQGSKKSRFIFDSTAIEGSEQFASRIQASLMPSWQQWAQLGAGDDIPEDEKDAVEKELKTGTDKFFSNINHSNFDTEITPALRDLSIGTGAILIEEADFTESSAFKFTCIPLSELYIEPSGGVWRKHRLPVQTIQDTWPEADLPPKLVKLLKEDPNQEVDIVNGMTKNQVSKKYDQFVVYEKSLLFTQSFNTKRLIPFRWSVTSGESYGRGPAITKLADIRTANKIVELILGNAAIQMAGVYTGRSDGIFNPSTARIAPGVILPVQTNDNSNPSIQALTPSGNLGIADGLLEMMQNSIRKGFFSEPLGEITDPVRSATENIIRNQEFLKQSGAAIGRLKTELIEPLIVAGVDILKELGKFPNISIDGKEATIRMLSPLAKAEKVEDFQNTQLWMSTLTAMLPPEVIAAKVKVEDLPSEFMKQLGVNPDLVRSEAETKALGEKVAQAAEQQIGGQQNAGV